MFCNILNLRNFWEQVIENLEFCPYTQAVCPLDGLNKVNRDCVGIKNGKLGADNR